MRRVFSGVQPTGGLTLGNYLGAIKHFVEMQDQYDCFYSVVDLHALTIPKDPAEFLPLIMDTAAYMLAAGLDPDKVTLFVQSDVSAHAELSWIMECTATFGELSRMTQFKEKSQGRESFSGGLFTYPCLMAADILLYDTDLVPVGDDQKQHVELTRDLAIRFNSRYGETFKVPEPAIASTGARIMSLSDPHKKMSKSDSDPFGAIFLGDKADDIAKKIRRAVTDSGREEVYEPNEKPAVANLLTIYAHCADMPIASVVGMYAGKGYADFKKGLAEAVIECLKPVQERYLEMSSSGYVKEALASGARKAMKVSSPVLRRAKERLGLPSLLG